MLKGHKFNNEQCPKCGKIHLHRHHTAETKLLISVKKQGQKYGPQSIIHSLRIGQALKGVQKSAEHNKHNSEAQVKYLAEHPERANALGKYNKGQKLRELYGEEYWQKRMAILRRPKSAEYHQHHSEAARKTWENFTPERRKEIRLNIGNGAKRYWENLSPEDFKDRLDINCSSVVRVSKNQLKLYNFLRDIFPTVVLEYPINKKIRGHYILDIALVEDKINFEYDSIRWHTEDKYVESNKTRDNYLRELGWVVIRVGELELKNFIKEK